MKISHHIFICLHIIHIIYLHWLESNLMYIYTIILGMLLLSRSSNKCSHKWRFLSLPFHTQAISADYCVEIIGPKATILSTNMRQIRMYFFGNPGGRVPTYSITSGLRVHMYVSIELGWHTSRPWFLVTCTGLVRPLTRNIKNFPLEYAPMLWDWLKFKWAHVELG